MLYGFLWFCAQKAQNWNLKCTQKAQKRFFWKKKIRFSQIVRIRFEDIKSYAKDLDFFVFLQKHFPPHPGLRIHSCRSTWVDHWNPLMSIFFVLKSLFILFVFIIHSCRKRSIIMFFVWKIYNPTYIMLW